MSPFIGLQDYIGDLSAKLDYDDDCEISTDYLP